MCSQVSTAPCLGKETGDASLLSCSFSCWHSLSVVSLATFDISSLHNAKPVQVSAPAFLSWGGDPRCMETVNKLPARSWNLEPRGREDRSPPFPPSRRQPSRPSPLAAIAAAATASSQRGKERAIPSPDPESRWNPSTCGGQSWACVVSFPHSHTFPTSFVRASLDG